MLPRSKDVLLALGTLLVGWCGARAVAPASHAGCEHANDPSRRPALSETEVRRKLAESSPWMLPLRDNRRGWFVTPGREVEESERLWEAAAPVDGLPAALRDRVLEELARKLEGARILLDREQRVGSTHGGLPSRLLWALQSEWLEARLQLHAFAEGRCRLLAMDDLPAGLSSTARDGVYLSAFLSHELRGLLLFRIDAADDPELHALESLQLRMQGQP